ncbi:MAG TPA: response regulator transcription factor, partial [Chloroflexota bacterium]
MEHEGKASGPQSAVKVLIVDDHPLAREGLRVILERLGKLSVVGLASNGAEALDLVAKSRPDVVVMDVRMPIMDGVEATRKIVERFPETRVVLITGYEDLPVLEDAVLAGASGLLLKDANIALLLGTISVVANGGLVIKRDFFPGLVEAFVHASRLHRRDGAQRAPHVLTSREMEVLDLLSRGLS